LPALAARGLDDVGAVEELLGEEELLPPREAVEVVDARDVRVAEARQVHELAAEIRERLGGDAVGAHDLERDLLAVARAVLGEEDASERARAELADDRVAIVDRRADEGEPVRGGALLDVVRVPRGLHVEEATRSRTRTL